MKKITLLFLSLFLFTGCATAPTDPAELAEYQKNNDPFEPTNRAIFKFNLAFERYALRPMTLGYRAITTKDTRESIRVFFNNLGSPIYMANDLLQGRLAQFGKDTSRFIINTTLGFFGFFDVANKMGIKPHKNSFSTTLYSWGVGTGPFLMLPIVGPKDVRGATGFVGDYAMNPLNYASSFDDKKSVKYLGLASTSFDPIVTYEQLMDALDDAYMNSADYYAFTRSAYRQGIDKMIRAELGEEEKVEKFNFDMEDDEE